MTISLSSLIKSNCVQVGESYALEVKQMIPKAKPETPPKVGEVVNDSSAVLAEEKQKAIDRARLILDEAQQEAAKIIEKGRQDAAVLYEEAQKTAEHLTQKAYDEAYQAGNDQGYEDGYNQGFTKGYEEAYNDNKAAGEALQKALHDFEEQRQDELVRSLDELKFLALEIAGKIVDERLKDDQDVYLRMIEKALETFRSYKWVDIYIGEEPQLAAYIESSLAERMAKSSKYLRVRMSEDKPVGYCTIETDAGVVDVSVQTQLEQIRDVLTENDQED